MIEEMEYNDARIIMQLSKMPNNEKELCLVEREVLTLAQRAKVMLSMTVVDIDSDGSFLMNVQELATIKVENLPVKIMILNNQHLGMVVQWEDRFYKANRAHTYLGDPSQETEIFPDFLKMAESCKIPAARVTNKADLRGAISKMLETPGPYLLDVIVPHQEQSCQ